MSGAKPKTTTPVSLTKKADIAGSGADRPASGIPRVDGLALVVARNTFYAQHYHKILYLVLAQFVAIVMIGAVLLRLFDFTASRDYYFPIAEDNKLIVERALYEPLFTDDEMKDWAQQAVTTTLTFGFYDYTMRWQESRSFFTPRGWASFTKAMDDINLLDTIGVVERKGGTRVVVARLRPGFRPEIKRQGIVGGQYVWEMTMPMDISFLSAEKEQRFSWVVDIRVVRMLTNNSRYGRGIEWLIAEQQE